MLNAVGRVLLALLGVSACACARASLPARSAAPCRSSASVTNAAAAVPSEPDPLAALPEVPTAGACKVEDQVQRNDVAWKLRTRLDAVPSLLVESGTVTAWLQHHWRTRGDGPNAVVELENAAMKLRAWVAPEDLNVVVKTAFVLQDSVIPDGVTEHRVVELDVDPDPDEIYLRFDLPQGEQALVPLLCTQLGLARRGIDTRALLPAEGDEVLVVRGAQLTLKSGRQLRVEDLSTVSGIGGYVSGGIAAILLDGDATRPLLRFEGTCGGTVFGRVARRDLRPMPNLRHGTSARCPGTGAWAFINPTPLKHLKTCAADVPLFVRSSTLEDPIGVLKAHAPFQVDEAGTPSVVISVLDSPVSLLPLAKLTIRARDLARCEDVRDAGE